jgi:hypothetical protein
MWTAHGGGEGVQPPSKMISPSLKLYPQLNALAALKRICESSEDYPNLSALYCIQGIPLGYPKLRLVIERGRFATRLTFPALALERSSLQN